MPTPEQARKRPESSLAPAIAALEKMAEGFRSLLPILLKSGLVTINQGRRGGKLPDDTRGGESGRR